jgi:integrase
MPQPFDRSVSFLQRWGSDSSPGLAHIHLVRPTGVRNGSREALPRAGGKPLEGYVWPAPTKSGHIDHSTLKKPHGRALKLSGVRPFVLYSLRHSFATRLAPHVDAWTFCKIMGWASLSVAMRYIHPSVASHFPAGWAQFWAQ